MRRLFLAAIVCCVGIASVASAADDKPDPRLAVQTLSHLEQLLSQVREKSKFLSGGVTKPCPMSGSTCSIPVTITETYDKPNGGVPLGCLISVDDFNVGSTTKTITWNLTLPAGSAADYQFYQANSGNLGRFAILVVEDGDAQFLKTTWNSNTSVSVTYKYSAKNKRVVYFPVVAQNFGTSDEVLCGAADPKIVNN
jgi:hypothetical protein